MTDSTWPYRVAIGLLIFSCLAIWDWIRKGATATRWKEYLFLFGATAVTMAYGILHDFITCSISPNYFVYGKGIPEAAGGFGLPVAWLAMQATWSVGLLCAAVFLIANNPDSAGRQLQYTRLSVHGAYPVVVSLLAEIFFAGLFLAWYDEIVEKVSAGRELGFLTRDFVLVWGMHFGAYLGAAFGLALAVWKIRGAKRKLPVPLLT